MAERVVIFSDTHLGQPGRGAGTPDALRPIWAGAQRLIINGDVAELSHPTWRTQAARDVLRIQELCEADGVQLDLLSGNHDPLVTDQRYLRLFDGTIFVTHGDVLHPAISPWNAYAPELLTLHRQALATLTPAQRIQLDTRLAAVQHASNMKWDHLATEPGTSRLARVMGIPPKLVRVLWYWLTMPDRAARFAAEHARESRFFIFGHYHRAGVWRRAGRTIINTGSFGGMMPPTAVVAENQRVGIHRIEHRGGEYRLATAAHRTFALHPQ